MRIIDKYNSLVLVEQTLPKSTLYEIYMNNTVKLFQSRKLKEALDQWTQAIKIY